MALLDLWRSNPEQLESYNVRQIVAFAGDGKLSDGNDCSSEFREFLATVQSGKLCEYIIQCLSDAFQDSGFVLQDLINEMARRLDFDVMNGRYRGARGQIGFDGLWHSPEGNHLIAEVKISDAYRINLDRLAKYRNELRQSETIGATSSILIIVGREDTGDLEAQIRGSRHAWDIRLLSAEALGKLVTLKEEAGDDLTAERIRSLLVPHEYTRLDPLIDVVFVTAEDVRRPVEEQFTADVSEASQSQKGQPQDRTELEVLEGVRQKIVSTFSKLRGKQLIKRSKAQYWSSDKELRVCCTVSKFYERTGNYWYAHHPIWHEFLSNGSEGYLILGLLDRDEAIALPISFVSQLLDDLNITQRHDGRHYWHIHVAKIEDDFVLRPKGGGLKTIPKEFVFHVD